MGGKLIVLGCGSSAGVPAIGNWWGACDPSQPRNYRTRPSIALQTDKTLLIVDTGPDFREQMNREKLGAPDAVLYTHEHSDHVNGLDELRTFQRLTDKKRYTVYSNAVTLARLRIRYDYMFVASENGFYPSVCDPAELKTGEKTTLGDITFTTFEQDHGTIKSLGFRFGNIGYSTDVKRLEQPAYDALKGIDTWIVDAAANHGAGNPVHASIEEVIAMNAVIGARQVYLTHLPPTMDYKTLVDELPAGYAPAYDGQTLIFRD